MGDLDLKYYLAVFWRRFPYFLLVTALISAVGLALAAILPPVYRSTATLLVEMPQIPDDLAQSSTAHDASVAYPCPQNRRRNSNASSGSCAPRPLSTRPQ